jgi:hypothetical protein
VERREMVQLVPYKFKLTTNTDMLTDREDFQRKAAVILNT